LLKMEALDFGSGSRDMDLAWQVMQFPLGQGWPGSKLKYLVPVFNGGCPFPTEMALAMGEGYPTVLFWAYDHVHLFGWDVRQIVLPSAQVV
jgi:hypothetical protein